MINNSFVMTPEEVKNFKEGTFLSSGARLDDFEGIYVSWATDPEAVKKMLPPPLQFALPIATAYIANVNSANYALPYLEAGIGVPAVYEGAVGLYFANFQLSGPGAAMATFLGREGGGIPKKFADDIGVTRNGDLVKAYVERDGIRIIDVEAEIGEYNTPDGKNVFGEITPGMTKEGSNFLFKFDFGQGPDGRSALSEVRLRKSTSSTLYKEWNPATAKVTLMPSENDPWASLPALKVLGAGYCKVDMHLIANQEIAKLDIEKIMPYLMKGKFDTVYLGKPSSKFHY